MMFVSIITSIIAISIATYLFIEYILSQGGTE